MAIIYTSSEVHIYVEGTRGKWKGICPLPLGIIIDGEYRECELHDTCRSWTRYTVVTMEEADCLDNNQ